MDVDGYKSRYMLTIWILNEGTWKFDRNIVILLPIDFNSFEKEKKNCLDRQTFLLYLLYYYVITLNRYKIAPMYYIHFHKLFLHIIQAKYHACLFVLFTHC